MPPSEDWACSRILERDVIPNLRVASISEETQKQSIALFEEFISTSIRRFGEHMRDYADIVSSHLQVFRDEHAVKKCLLSAKKTQGELENYISNGRKYHTDMLKERLLTEKSVGEICTNEQLPSLTINKHFRRLRNDLIIPSIIDHLVAGHVLTENDEDSIIHKRYTDRDKNEELLKRICDKCNVEQFANIVLPAIKEHHPHLEEMLQGTFRELAHNRESESPEQCGWCLIQSRVEPTRLADHLLNDDAITQNLYTDLRNASVTNSEKWSILENSLKRSYTLEKAIRNEYPALTGQIIRNGFTIKCMCSDDKESSVHQENTNYPSTPSDVGHISDLDSTLNGIGTMSIVADRTIEPGKLNESFVKSLAAAGKEILLDVIGECHFVLSQSLLPDGDMREDVIDHLNKASEAFQKANDDNGQGKAILALAHITASKSKAKRALKIFQNERPFSNYVGALEALQVVVELSSLETNVGDCREVSRGILMTFFIIKKLFKQSSSKDQAMAQFFFNCLNQNRKKLLHLERDTFSVDGKGQLKQKEMCVSLSSFLIVRMKEWLNRVQSAFQQLGDRYRQCNAYLAGSQCKDGDECPYMQCTINLKCLLL
ncbi:uncharacterized protein LOC121373406 [Gigantopelta aegis]|uniref:uncharacterized protein LOC121373406 n=1 Tax=Gigantopelta aegis TaxID=1735272 RepID=UPI001B88C904|nr:uncharacterized protein LOC121373406 [Gigantopelta aegis]